MCYRSHPYGTEPSKPLWYKGFGGFSLWFLTVSFIIILYGAGSAKVIARIGFIGACAIIVTRRRRVKGLTTAAGLWACAIVGLACGAGFYEGAVCATFLILLAEIVFSKLEYRYIKRSPEINMYVEYSQDMSLDEMIRLIRSTDIKITDLEITRGYEEGKHNACAIFTLQIAKWFRYEEFLGNIAGLDGMFAVEEL